MSALISGISSGVWPSDKQAYFTGLIASCFLNVILRQICDELVVDTHKQMLARKMLLTSQT